LNVSPVNRSRVWQRAHIDFAEKDGNSFLCLVDSLSKWIEVAHMTSTSAKRTIDQLRAWFAAYGLPEEVVTDNSPQFIASEFVDFLKQNGVKQMPVPPYHPSSNGAAERTVQIPKQALQKEAERVRKGCPEAVFETPTRKLSVPVQKHSSFCYRSDTSRTVLKAQTSHQFSVLKPNMEMHIQTSKASNSRSTIRAVLRCVNYLRVIR